MQHPDIWKLFELTRAGEWEGLEAYLNRMLELCSQLFDASGASLFLGHEGSDEFELAGTSGSLSKIPYGAKLRAGEGIAGTAIHAEKPMLVLDPLGDAALRSAQVERREDIGSSMVIPLVTPLAGCFGVLNLARKAGTEAFQDADLAHAESIAAQIALAVSNARLFVKTNLVMSDLRSASEKLQAVVECVGVGIVVVDRHFQVTQMNPQATAILGDLLQGNGSAPLGDALSEVFREPILAAIKGAASGETQTAQVEDRAAQRSWSLVGSPLASGGAVVALQETTEIERQRSENARLQRLAEMGQMTAAIAHEIRNPLTGILSAAQMTQQMPEQAPEFGAMIEQEVLKLGELCEEFLEFARPLQVNVRAVDLNGIARLVADSERPAFEEAGVNLVLRESGVSSHVTTDPVKVEQALRNLVRNAREACIRGGCVEILVDGPTLQVIDNGQGMEGETLSKLFTPFFTTRPSGTGLGLSNVKRIVDAVGAEISVESEMGHGTCFSLAFDTRLAA